MQSKRVMLLLVVAVVVLTLTAAFAQDAQVAQGPPAPGMRPMPMQPGMRGMQPGMQPGMPGMQPGMPGMQPGMPGMPPMMGMGQAQLAVNNDFVFILRGNTLFEFSIPDLHLVNQVELPMPGPRPGMGQGGMGQGQGGMHPGGMGQGGMHRGSGMGQGMQPQQLNPNR